MKLWVVRKQVPIPGTTQMSHLIENIGATAVRFTPTELAELNRSVSAIQIRGARLPDAVLIFSGVERLLGTEQKSELLKRRDGQSCAKKIEPEARSAKPGTQASKKRMSSATRANLSAKLKDYWAAKKKSAKRLIQFRTKCQRSCWRYIERTQSCRI